MVTPPGVHRFAALDGLRGVAALVVAAEHLHANGPLFSLAFFRNGLFFVDFFFVLSGFVIAASYAERLRAGFPAQRFLWLRFWRVWPVHVLVLGAYLAIELAVWAGGSGLTGRSAFGPERALWQLAVQLLLLQAVVTPALYAWVLQSWSISVELVLYAVAALGWGKLRRGWWQVWLALSVLAGLGMALFPEQVGLHHKLLRGFSGFGLGVVTFALWQRAEPRLAALPRRAAGVLELACLIIVAAAVHRAGDEAVFWLYCLGFAGVVLVFAAERGAVSRLLLGRHAQFLGAVSYSIYMVHTLVQSAAGSIAARLAGMAGLGHWFAVPQPGSNRPTLTAEAGLWADLFALAVLGAVVLAAWLVWRLVEDPVRRWSRRQADC